MSPRIALGLVMLAAPVLAATPAFAQADDAAAQQMINDPNPATFAVWGLSPAPKSVKDDSVQGGRSVHVAVTGTGNPWDISVNVPIIKPIKAGDHLQMMYYARLEKPATGETGANINAQLQISSAPYTVVIGGPQQIGTDWKIYIVEGRADKDYAKGTLNATFHLNTGKHTIGMGLVAIFDKGQ
jgi:hypothetical protein